MKKMRRRKILIMTLIMTFLLTACRSGAERYELSNYIGKSVSTFEKRSGTELVKQSNGVYTMEGVVQVIAPVKKVTSVSLLDKTGKYTMFGIAIGMKKDAVDALLAKPFGKEVSQTEDTVKKTITYSYLKDKKQLYLTYDTNNNTLTELSYYKVTDEEQKAEATIKSVNTGEMMLTVGDTKIYYNEAMAYLKSAQDKYESDYGNSIWKADILGNGETFGKMLKDEVINQITELKIIRAEAQKLKITLTEEEQAEADSYAKDHFNGLKEEDRQRYLITEELLQQVYSDNLLANKVFETKTINVDTNVSDEEAKQITVQDIYIQNYNLDSEGKKVPLSEEDKKQAYDKVKALLKQAKETKDFKTLAEANSEKDIIEYTFGKGGAPKDYGTIFEKAAFSLKTGQLSDIITTDNGWHILYCISDFNEDATTQVKENIIEKRRTDMFAKLYDKWSKDYQVIINKEAWNTIPLDK